MKAADIRKLPACPTCGVTDGAYCLGRHVDYLGKVGTHTLWNYVHADRVRAARGDQ